jgi:hypothetical protein
MSIGRDSFAETTATLATTRLRGWRLLAMRALVMTTMLVVVSLFALAVPGLYTRFSVPCADALDQCLLYPQQVAPLAMLDLTPSSLALIAIGVSYVTILLVILIAIAILWRRSNDGMALFLALTLVLMPTLFTSVLQALPDSWQGIPQILNDAAIATFFLLIALFPNGRFAPHWLWLPTLAIIAVAIFPFPTISGPVESVLNLVLGLTTLGAYLCLIASQIYRYRRVSSAAERQQIKWGVYGFILALIVNQAYWQPLYWIPSLRRSDSLYTLLVVPDSLLILCIVAISFFVAIQRYRLYDIDPLVNKALVYGSLSVILAIVYIGGVIGLQALARTITGQDSPIALVASTLLIAGLFQPLRGFLQRTIDRRFYRSKYDAQKTLAAFNTTLRQEISLTELQAHLVAVVEQTMRPAHVSLWLAPSPTAAPHTASPSVRASSEERRAT